jgi:uncharacterized protein (TIRG00374 family)
MTLTPNDVEHEGAPRRAVWIALLIGIPLSVVLLWLAARNADLDEVADALRSADLLLLVPAIAVFLAVFVLQGIRWHGIVGTGEPGGPRCVELVLAGVACNNVLPGRLGDLFRAREIAVEARLPSGRGLATVVLDRSFDVVALVLFLAVSLPTVVSESWLLRIAAGAAFLVVGIAAGLLFARRYTRARTRGRRDRGVVRRLLRDLLEGLATPLGRRRIGVAFALSLAVWASWAVGAALVARSLGIELTVLDAVFVTAVICLGAAIPSSPGFVGTFQWLAVQSLAVLGVGNEEGLAFSILAHASWYVPTTLAGGFVLLARVDWGAFRGRARVGYDERGSSPQAQ